MSRLSPWLGPIAKPAMHAQHLLRGRQADQRNCSVSKEAAIMPPLGEPKRPLKKLWPTKRKPPPTWSFWSRTRKTKCRLFLSANQSDFGSMRKIIEFIIRASMVGLRLAVTWRMSKLGYTKKDDHWCIDRDRVSPSDPHITVSVSEPNAIKELVSAAVQTLYKKKKP